MHARRLKAVPFASYHSLSRPLKITFLGTSIYTTQLRSRLRSLTELEHQIINNMNRGQDPSKGSCHITHDLISIWCGCTYIHSYSSHCHSLEPLTPSPFASTLSHLRHHRPSSENPNFYINPLHLPLLLFLFLCLVVSPWANLMDTSIFKPSVFDVGISKRAPSPHIFRSPFLFRT